MKKHLLLYSLLVLFSAPIWASITDDLRDQINRMRDGETITLDYGFEGCYGPYHQGQIEITLADNIFHYKNHSYADKEAEAFTQSGQYQRRVLMQKLAQADHKMSSTVYGNRLNYQIKSQNNSVTGSDRIERRHFIDIFHPFPTFMEENKQEVIPQLKTGGFVR